MAAFSFPFYKAPREACGRNRINVYLHASISQSLSAMSRLHLRGVSGVIFWDINFFCNAVMRRVVCTLKDCRPLSFSLPFHLLGEEEILVFGNGGADFLLRNPWAVCKCRLLILPLLQRKDLLGSLLGLRCSGCVS